VGWQAGELLTGQARPESGGASDRIRRLDTSVPHPARVYDYWLGGKDNFEADRAAAELALAETPTILPGVTANLPG
jgi:hypothetical protein